MHYQLLVSDMMHLGTLGKIIDRVSEDNRRVMWLDLSQSMWWWNEELEDAINAKRRLLKYGSLRLHTGII